MSLTKGKNRILLHLLSQRTFEEIGVEAPYALCQKGIAEAVDLSRNRTSELIRELISEGLVKEDVNRIVGLERRRKIYSLTHDGRKKAEKIREELEKKEVKLKMEASETEVRLKEIDSYISSKEPLLVAVNKLDEKNIIDLTKSEESTGDIFTGRIKEIEVLGEHLKKARKGTSKAVLIKGEAGIGKTRLVTEFKNEILGDQSFSEEIEFVTGKGIYERLKPYIPFQVAFEKLEDGCGESFNPFNFDDSDPAVDDVSDYKREIIYSKTIKRLEEICKDKLLVIFIDDLQWVDKASLKLFHHMIEKLRDSPLLFIGAYRPEDVDENDFLKEVIQRMSRQHLFKELELEPLGWEDTKNIIQNYINSLEVNDDFIQLIHETAEGNPLFIKELVKQMIEDDIIEPDQGKNLSKSAEIDLPRVINDIIERRVKKLNDETLKILRMGSVIGEEIPYTLIRSVSDKDPFELLENIDILTGNGIWEEAPSEDRYMFSHGLIHKSIYENIPKSFRKDFHVSVAEELKKEFEEDIEQHYLDIAYHYKSGEIFDEACEFYLLAAQRARNLYAHEDAIEMYQEVIDLAKKSYEDLKEKKWKAYEGLGDCYKTLGEYEKSMEYYDEIPFDKIKPEEQQKIYRKIASIHEREGEFKKTLGIIEKGLADKYQVSRESCRLLCKKGNALMRQGNYDSATGEFELALALCQNQGSDREYAQIQQGLGNVYHYKGNYDKAKEHLEEALKTWKKIDSLAGESATLNSLGIIHLNKGKLDKALNYYEKSLEKREKRGDKRDIYSTLNNIGTIYLRKGNFDEAKKYYKKSLSTWNEIGDKQGIAISLINLGEYHFRKGNFEKALKKQRESLDVCRDINFKKGEAASLSNLGKIYFHIENYEKSLDYYEKSLELCQNIGFKSLLPHPYRGLALISLKKDNIEKALDHAKTALDMSLETDSLMEEGIVRKVLGVIYREMKRYEEAENEFERSKKIFEDVGERKELALSLNELSILKGLIGKEEEKKANFEESVSILEDLNLEFWLKKVKNS